MQTTILMYHAVRTSGGGALNPHCISERNFRGQMRQLEDSGRPVLPWPQLSTGREGSAPAVGVTFDDANHSDIACSRVLEHFGYSALFFVPTEYIDQAGRLAKSDIADLWRRGMGIGSHGHQHVPLVHLGDSQLAEDLARSKAILEDIVGAPVEHLSFPAGSYDRRVLSVARTIGFKCFYTSEWGSNSAREMASGVLRRVPVVDGLCIEAFNDIVEARHRWSKQAQFHLKELAKRALGERNYLRMRRALASRRSVAD